jgi:3-oxoadipate enol-lactonase
MTEAGFVPVEGGSLYYEADGNGNPMLLIHAGVANLRMWDPHVPRLAEQYRVVRYDTRGYGRSESEHVEFSNRADAAAVLDHVGVESALVVGASRGGMIALDLTLERPHRVDALVVVAGGVGGYSSPSDEGQEQVWEEAERMWEAKDWERLADFETRWWVDGPGQLPDRVDPGVRALVHGWILDTYRAEKEEGIPQPLDPPAVGRLDEISTPTLVVVGDLDDPGTVDACEVLAAGVADARLLTFEGCAHMLNLERPERFTNTVLEFLAGVEAGWGGVSDQSPGDSNRVTGNPSASR